LTVLNVLREHFIFHEGGHVLNRGRMLALLHSASHM